VIQGATQILSGRARAVLVGGAESMSNTPLLFPAETALPMGRLAKARTLGQRLSAIATLRPRHFKPEAALIKGLTDPTCGLIMGKTAEILAREFDLSRDDQDAFALRSHRRAAEAIEAGRFDNAIVPIYAGKRHTPVTGDVGPRPDQTLEALAKLKPIFDRRDGTVTVGNACQVTDGAVALLLMDAELARAEGYEILASVDAWSTAGCDPARMGLGPVYATHRLLKQTGLSLKDFDLVEINEAFAAQVLACLKAMASDDYAQRHLDRSKALGELDPDKLNVNGGAIALGHPVGATGARIVLEAALELRRRDARRALATLCVGGGQGSAVAIGRGELS